MACCLNLCCCILNSRVRVAEEEEMGLKENGRKTEKEQKENKRKN